MTTTALLVGVLDDDQNAAREFGPWSELGDAADVTIGATTSPAPARLPSAWRRST
jgi:hypothetical protein